MEQTRNSRVCYYMTLKCDLDLEVESGYLSRGLCTLSLREHLGEVYSKKFKGFSKHGE